MSELRELPIRITRQKVSFTGVGEKPYEGEPDFGEELFATLNSLKLEGASQDYGRTLFNATFTGDLEEGYRSVRQEVEQRSARWRVRLEIPEDMQKKYGYAPLGPANGPVKNAIFGGNNARLYNVSAKQQAEIIGDRVASIKETYEKHGTGRANLAYGYVNKAKA